MIARAIMTNNAPKTDASIFRVRAHNAASDSENKIHDDQIAAAHGFHGGLVPGVTVYGYMVPAILARMGPAWIEYGAIDVRFVAPCYEDEIVIARCDGSTVTAEHEDGSLYASGIVSLHHPTGSAAGEEEQLHQLYPVHILPDRDQRPVASDETVVVGKPLGTLRRVLDAATVPAIPERLLHLANEILGQNYRMSPWIHAGSQVRHRRLPALGAEITVTGAIVQRFERKGKHFAVAGLSFFEGPQTSEANLVAHVRHTFIYELG